MGWINPDTGSEVEIEEGGDYTVTWPMKFPEPSDDEG